MKFDNLFFEYLFNLNFEKFIFYKFKKKIQIFNAYSKNFENYSNVNPRRYLKANKC